MEWARAARSFCLLAVEIWAGIRAVECKVRARDSSRERSELRRASSSYLGMLVALRCERTGWQKIVTDCVFQAAAAVMIWFQTAKRLVISVRHSAARWWVRLILYRQLHIIEHFKENHHGNETAVHHTTVGGGCCRGRDRRRTD